MIYLNEPLLLETWITSITLWFYPNTSADMYVCMYTRGYACIFIFIFLKLFIFYKCYYWIWEYAPFKTWSLEPNTMEVRHSSLIRLQLWRIYFQQSNQFFCEVNQIIMMFKSIIVLTASHLTSLQVKAKVFASPLHYPLTSFPIACGLYLTRPLQTYFNHLEVIKLVTVPLVAILI